jgi:hypothetical protein
MDEVFGTRKVGEVAVGDSRPGDRPMESDWGSVSVNEGLR